MTDPTNDEIDEHLPWSELAAGHALSSLGAQDQARYLSHEKDCEQCRQLAAELAMVVAELAYAAPPLVAPDSLKTAIMSAVAADGAALRSSAEPIGAAADSAGAPESLDRVRARREGRRRLLSPVWSAAAAVVVLAAIGAGIVIHDNSSSTSVADQCAKVKCPTVQLSASGRAVATVMMLDGTAWVDTSGLPATPADSRYVLWRISNGTPIAVAEFSSTPTAGPVKAGPVAVPVSQVGELAISQEPGQVAPVAPTDVLAQGVLAG